MENNVIETLIKEHDGTKYVFHLGARAENIITNDERQFISKAELADLKAKPSTTSPVSDNTVTFMQAGTRTNIESGDKLSVIAGKVRKWLSDLGTAAFQGVSNTLGITAAGYVLDARAGKALNDKFGNCTFSVQSDGAYVTYTPTGGADPVTKKLGELEAVSLPLSILTTGNNKREITAGPIDFSNKFFLKIIYDYNTSNREALHIDIYNGETVLLHEYLAKGYSVGTPTLQENLTSIIDVSGIGRNAYLKIWADSGEDDGIGNFVIKSMIIYSK